jgi:hypothetical protein
MSGSWLEGADVSAPRFLAVNGPVVAVNGAVEFVNGVAVSLTWSPDDCTEEVVAWLDLEGLVLPFIFRDFFFFAAIVW